MRDPAGQLTDRLQLLSMPQHLLGLAAFGGLDFEFLVGLEQLVRALCRLAARRSFSLRNSCSALRIRSSALTVASSSSGSIGSTRNPSAPPSSASARSCGLVIAAEVCSTATPGNVSLDLSADLDPMDVR